MMSRIEVGSLHAALKQHFGFDGFRTGQEQAVQSLLGGRDVILVMPTGSGKSLCYQLPAMILDGVSIVVSPLIALMKDQVDGLNERGINATFINSSLSLPELRERSDGLYNGRYRLVYVAPERFRNRRFQDLMQSLNITLLAIDEAHCISQWGHDFRPDYLRLRYVVEQLPQARIMALTATATPEVCADIVTQLGLGQHRRQAPDVLVYGFERPNLKLVVHQTGGHKEKMRHIRRVLRDYPCGIVYCATRKQTEKVYEILRDEGVSCCCYHGGMEDGERKRIQDRFMNGEDNMVVATNAFGMGIDKPDVRFVIHWDIPGSLEAYYQEIGRAGRDGRESICALLYNYADVRTQEFFIEGANPSRGDFMAVWSAVCRDCQYGPVTRSSADWAEHAPGVRNDMAVRTILANLERAGLITRKMEPGNRRCYTVTLVPDADLSALESQLSYSEKKRQRDELKLQTMIRYVRHVGCRHAYILKYFGENKHAADCRACDHCLRAVDDKAHEPTEDEWIVIQKILSCIARMKGRYGRKAVIDVLIGSRRASVVDRGLDRLSTFGLLKKEGEAYVRQVLNELIRDGSARIAEGEYPLVELTARGSQVIWRKVPLKLILPESPAAARAQAGGNGASANKTAEQPKQGLTDDFPEYDHDIYDALKAWRLERARGEKVRAYQIFADRTLRGIAAVRPQTLAELEAIKGVGQVKIQRYGDAVLQIVDKQRT